MNGTACISFASTTNTTKCIQEFLTTKLRRLLREENHATFRLSDFNGSKLKVSTRGLRTEFKCPGLPRSAATLYDLHMLIFWICVFIGVGVFSVMFYSIYHHRKSKGHIAEQFHENTTVEIIWTIIPTLILIGMAIPATKTLLELDDVQDSQMSIKVTGWQWKWEYEYIDQGVHFFSSLDEASNKARQVGSGVDPRSIPNYLLNVDHPLVVPVKTKIRFLFTAADVLHSWWVPEFRLEKRYNSRLY